MSVIKIPDQFYCGVKASGLGFITPEGTDKAAIDRKDTVNHWADSSERTWIDNPKYDPDFEPKNETQWDDPRRRKMLPGPTTPDDSKYFTFENLPVEGIKLYGQVQRWSTSNQVWEIEDPRGFRIQLYSANMFKVLQHCGIVNGEFVGKFVYGREGAKNILLPIGSDIYKAAKEHTDDTKAGTVPLKSLSVGDKVILLFKGERRECHYAGRYWKVETRGTAWVPPAERKRGRYVYAYGRRGYRKVWTDEQKRPLHYFIPVDRPGELFLQNLLAPVQPKVLKVVKPKSTPIAKIQSQIVQLALDEQAAMNDPYRYRSRYNRVGLDGHEAFPEKICRMCPNLATAKDWVESRKQMLADFKDHWVHYEDWKKEQDK